MIPDIVYLGTAQVARLLHRSKRHVLSLIAGGKLPAVKEEQRWQVLETDALELKKLLPSRRNPWAKLPPGRVSEIAHLGGVARAKALTPARRKEISVGAGLAAVAARRKTISEKAEK